MVIPVAFEVLPGYGLPSSRINNIRVEMTNNTPTTEAIMAEIEHFRQQQKTLILATSSSEHQSLASYAPFIEDENGCFYLLLSGLAEHSVNLRQHQSEGRSLSVLLIQDERDSRNLFARKRLSYQCNVEIWSREHPQWPVTIERLQEKFGKTIEVLAGLGDFQLYQLTPRQGNYVRGFGQAYELEDARVPMLKDKSV